MAPGRHCPSCYAARPGEDSDASVGSDKDHFPIKETMHFISCCRSTLLYVYRLSLNENEDGRGGGDAKGREGGEGVST